MRELDGCDEGSSSMTSVANNHDASSFYKFPSHGISAESLSSFPQSLRSRNLIDQHSGESVNIVEFSDDGAWFVSGGADGRVLLWPTGNALDDEWTPEPIEIDAKHVECESAIMDLAMSPYNDRIFSCGRDKKLLIHDANTYLLLLPICLINFEHSIFVYIITLIHFVFPSLIFYC